MKVTVLLGAFCMAWLLAGCGEPEIGMPATPTPSENAGEGTPEATSTPEATPTPSESPTPTMTPTPTGTPTPTPTPLPEGETAWDYSDIDVSWIDPSKPMVALTIDDGPAASSSQSILDTLEKYGAHCTFFWVGDRTQTYKEAAERAISLGCEVGNHSYGHEYLNKLSESEISYQINEGVKALNELTGWNKQAYIFRCPGGNVTDYVKSIVNAPIIYWSVDTRDWESRDCDKIVAKLVGQCQDGDIILCHEIYGATADALAIAIPKLQAEGFQIVSVSEMFKAKGIVMLNGHQYSSSR